MIFAALSFHVAWLIPELAACILIYAVFLIQLSALVSARVAFRLGFLSGLLVFAPHLAWFWNIFGIAAPCLWSVLAVFTAVFVLLLHAWRRYFGTRFIWLAAPILWAGLEYFRSEVYFLKFSWLSVGYAFSERSGLLPIGFLGVYGMGFVIFFAAAFISVRARNSGGSGLIVALACLALMTNAPKRSLFSAASPKSTPTTLEVAGIQLEFPPALEIPKRLDRLLGLYPRAQLFVLSEYSFDSEIPRQVREWCRKNQRYLIAGGKDDLAGGNFYNTAFVVGPNGEVIFQQAKSVPIQFFKDGLPARSQQVWKSPWGEIAIPVCYDLSYRRVMDRFIQAGARAIIVPFMDVTDWGAQQHRLHTRIGPIRAGEYGVPIFRVGSSGISQNIDATGQVLATLPYPGRGQCFSVSLQIPKIARLPVDHWLAPVCSMACGAFMVCLPLLRTRNLRLEAYDNLGAKQAGDVH